MKLKLSTLGITAGLLIGAAVTAGTAQAQTTNSLTVVNATFTNPTVSSGGYSIGVPGWTLGGSGAVDAVLHPSSAYVNQTGSQVGQIYSNGGGWSSFFEQDLTSDFVPGDTYTLTADVLAASSGFELVIDNPGVAILAATPISIGSANTLNAVSVSWTDPLVGQPGSITSAIEIAVHNIAGTPGGDSFIMDNFQVSQVSPVPEPSTWALFGVAIFCGLVVRHRISRNKEINS